MPDFGLATVLNASNDLRQRRQDDATMLALQQQRQQQLQQQRMERLGALSVISQYQGQVNDLSRIMLPQDLKRVNEQIQPYKDKMKEDLKSFGSDPNNFLLQGGQIKLQNFINQYQSLPAYQKGILNRQNLQSILKDIANPKIILNDSTWNVNGQPKTGTAEENVIDFQNGLTDTINYNGSFDTPKLDTSRYSKEKRDFGQVPTEIVNNDIQLMNGLTGSQMAQWWRHYGQSYLDPNDPNKTIFQYGGENPDDTRYKQLRNLNLEKKLSAEDKSMLSTYNAYAQYGGDPQTGASIGYNAVAKQMWNTTDENGQSKQIPVQIETYYTLPKRVALYANTVGLNAQRDPHTKELTWTPSWTTPRTVMRGDGMPMTLKQEDIRDLMVDPSNIYVIRDENGNAQQFLLGHFFLSAEATENNGLSFYRSHNFGGQRHGYGFFHGGSDVPAYIPLSANDAEQYYFNKSFGERNDVASGYADQQDAYADQQMNAEDLGADILAGLPTQ